MRKQFLKGLFLIIFLQTASAQQHFMWRYSEENGLPSMTIYDIFISDERFIYLATDAGCYRFDGINFKELPAIESRSRGLTAAKYSPDKKIWYKNFAGQIFYLENDTLKSLKSWQINTRGLDIAYFGFDSQNKLWIQTTAGSIWYSNPQKTEFYALDLSFIKLSKKMVQSIVINNDSLWASTIEGDLFVFNLLNLKGRTIKNVDKQRNLIYGLSNSTVYAKERERDEFFYLWDGNQLKKDEKISAILKGKMIINQTDKLLSPTISNHDFWIITNKGAFLFYKDGSYLKFFENESVSDVTLDHEGNYWFSTSLNGFYMMPSLSVKIYNHQNSPWNDSRITRLSQSKSNKIFLANYSGNIYSVNRNVKLITEYKKKSESMFEIEFLEYDSAKSLIYTSSGIYDEKKTNPILTDFYIKQGVFFDGYAQVATSTFSGFIQINPNSNTNKIKYFLKNSSKLSKRNDLWILQLYLGRSRCVLYDESKEHYWFGDSDGLKCYDYYGKMKEVKDTSGNSIIATSIAQHKNGMIAVSAMQQGIFIIENDSVTHHYSKKNGLRTDMGGKIKIYQPTDSMIELWQCTHKGIQIVNVNSGKLEFIDKRDGLGTDMVMDLLLIEDTVWAATNIGLLKFPKSLKEPNFVEPLIYLQSVKIKEKEVAPASSYRLDYDQNNLYISFQALCYKSYGKFQYKYRMLGLDSNWIYTASSNNFARFISLPYGKFSFEAKAINEDGVESKDLIRIEIEILKPFWEKWWFILLVFFLTISSISGLFFFIIRNIKIRNKLLLSKAKLETDLRSSRLASLKAQMNPHFMFNALNSIQEFILTNDKKQANYYLGKFANLMRLILDMSNLTVVSLEDEIKSLQLYLELEALRFEDGFEYQITVEPTVDTAEIHIPPLLVQPYVENAIKHGLMHQKSEKKLQIGFTILYQNQQKLLGCTIEDNGIGRQKSKELQALRQKNHTSFATGATAKRLELLHFGHNVETKIEDLACGTRVFITIPV